MSNQSIADRAIQVLAQLATLTDDVDNDDHGRHAIRSLKSQVATHLDAALRTAEGMLAMKDHIRELAPLPKNPR